MNWNVAQWSAGDWLVMLFAGAMVGFAVVVTAKDQREKFTRDVWPHWRRWAIERPPARFFAKKAGWALAGLAASAFVIGLFWGVWKILSVATSQPRP